MPAAGVGVQPEAHLGQAVAVEPQADAAAEDPGPVRALDRPAELLPAPPAVLDVRQERAGVGEPVAAVGGGDHRPADALGVAALLDHPPQVGGDQRAHGDAGGDVHEDRHLVGVHAAQLGGLGWRGHGPIQASPDDVGQAGSGRRGRARLADVPVAHYAGPVITTLPAPAAERSAAVAAAPPAPAVEGPLLPDADEGDAHRPGDSVGVPAPVAAARPARPRTTA